LFNFVKQTEAKMAAHKLSPLQLELLKVYSFQPSEEDLLAVKQMLASYFSNKLISKIGEAVEEKGISEEDLEKWLDD